MTLSYLDSTDSGPSPRPLQSIFELTGPLLPSDGPGSRHARVGALKNIRDSTNESVTRYDIQYIRMGAEPCDGRCYRRSVYGETLVCLDRIETLSERRQSMRNDYDISVLKVSRNLIVRTRPEDEDIRVCAEGTSRTWAERVRTDKHDAHMRHGFCEFNNELYIDSSIV